MTNTRIIWILLTITIILMVVIGIQNKRLITPAAPLGILSLQFSTSALQIDSIRAEWVGPVRRAFYVNTILDYIYLTFYGLFLFFTSAYYSLLRSHARKAGRYAALSGITAAALDAVENLLMMLSISYGGNDTVAWTTVIIASMKFLLAGIALLYIIISAIQRRAGKARK